MKKIVQSLCLGLTLALCANVVKAQTLIHYWDFNLHATTVESDTLMTDGIIPIPSTYSLVGAGEFWYIPKAGVAINDSMYYDYVDPGDTLNTQMGDSVGACLRMRNPSDLMQGVFSIPSTGHNNVVIRFATESTTNGPKSQYYAFSKDSGTTWQGAASLSVDSTSGMVLNTWYLITIRLDSTADNNSKLLFRIEFGPNDTSYSGNDRFDNFSVSDTTVQFVSSGPNSVQNISANVLPCSLYPNPVNNNVNITIPVEGEKSIEIYNAIGQKVYNTNTSEKELSINTAMLSSGLYFMNVQSGSQHNLMQFIKN